MNPTSRTNASRFVILYEKYVSGSGGMSSDTHNCFLIVESEDEILSKIVDLARYSHGSKFRVYGLDNELTGKWG